MKYRYINRILPSSSTNQLVILTGARQTGKTVSVIYTYPELKRINLDSPEERDALQNIHSHFWGRDIGNVVIDEAQKEPIVFDKIKYAFDEGHISFSVLTGSSQILLLKKIRESLAGRVRIYEIWPLLLSEIMNDREKPPAELPPICDVCRGRRISDIFSGQPGVLIGKKEAVLQNAEKYFLKWGGMPAMLNLGDNQRWKWLKDYVYTYLERDLSDLARLDYLEPFKKFQKLTAMRSSCLLNYSELARDSSVSIDTAKRYMEYLNISYQAFLLQPYYKNLTSSVIKTPKVYWVDTGIYRYLTGFRGEISGQLYETMVIAEIVKWNRTLQLDSSIYYYRTRSGMELDALIDTCRGITGVEIKSRENLSLSDTRALRVIADSLNGQWLGGMVVYTGKKLYKICEPDIWAVPSTRLFG